jgi:nickel transport protein
MIRFLSRAGCAAVLVLALAAPALAHRVNIFAWAEAGQIHTESKFQGGNMVSGGTVEVRDAATDALLLSGNTDGEGKWSFPVPAEFRDKKPDLVLVVKAGEGHQGQWKLAAADYLDAGPAPAEAAAPAAAPAETPAPAAAPADLSKLVDQAVEARLAPLRKQVAELAEPSPGAAEILGGLGFLMGLGGMVMASRRRKG